MKQPASGSSSVAGERQRRLADQLRANLKRRKAQARARAGGADRAAEDAGVADAGEGDGTDADRQV